MSGNQRVRLVVLVALITVFLLNAPVLRIVDQFNWDGVGLATPFIFAVWAVCIGLCALIVLWRRS